MDYDNNEYLDWARNDGNLRKELKEWSELKAKEKHVSTMNYIDDVYPPVSVELRNRIIVEIIRIFQYYSRSKYEMTVEAGPHAPIPRYRVEGYLDPRIVPFAISLMDRYFTFQDPAELASDHRLYDHFNYGPIFLCLALLYYHQEQVELINNDHRDRVQYDPNLLSEQFKDIKKRSGVNNRLFDKINLFMMRYLEPSHGVVSFIDFYNVLFKIQEAISGPLDDKSYSRHLENDVYRTPSFLDWKMSTIGITLFYIVLKQNGLGWNIYLTNLTNFSKENMEELVRNFYSHTFRSPRFP